MSADFRDEMSAVLETSGKAALKRWSRMLEEGSKRKERFTCRFCSQRNEVEVEGLPDEEVRHVVRFLTESTLAKPKQEEDTARLREIRVHDIGHEALTLSVWKSVSDAELAELEANLEQIAPLTDEERELWDRITAKRDRVGYERMMEEHRAAVASRRGGSSAGL